MLLSLLNPRLQMSHLKGQVPVWTYLFGWIRLGRVNEYNIKQESYMWLFKSPGVGKVFVHSEHLWGFVWWNFNIQRFHYL